MATLTAVTSQWIPATPGTGGASPREGRLVPRTAGVFDGLCSGRRNCCKEWRRQTETFELSSHKHSGTAVTSVMTRQSRCFCFFANCLLSRNVFFSVCSEDALYVQNGMLNLLEETSESFVLLNTTDSLH